MKEDIVSVTLTELSLVLLFLVIIISYSDSLTGRRGNTASEEMENLRNSLIENETELKRAREKLAILERERTDRKPKSLQRPSCIERGAAAGFLEGSNDFSENPTIC